MSVASSSKGKGEAAKDLLNLIIEIGPTFRIVESVGTTVAVRPRFGGHAKANKVEG